MRAVVLSLFLSSSLCLLSACAGGGNTPQANTPVSRGHEIFLTHCVACHMGEGDPPGPNGGVLDSSYLGDKAAFVQFLRKPATGMMPPFSPSQLPDADAAELYRYLTSPPKAK